MDTMIVVMYASDVIGNGVFWTGPPEEVKSIINIPARNLARLVAKDGKTRSIGMWTVKELKEPTHDKDN